MKKKYERTVLRPLGEGTVYKTIKQHVAWCDYCDEQIRGNGSILIPYACSCRTYRWHSQRGEYQADEPLSTPPKDGSNSR
jgi:hypothetical protein